MSEVHAEKLKSFIERIERLEEEKSSITTDISMVYAEAKATGFEPKVMRQIIKMRKKDTNELQEEHYMLDVYLNALGMRID